MSYIYANSPRNVIVRLPQFAISPLLSSISIVLYSTLFLQINYFALTLIISNNLQPLSMSPLFWALFCFSLKLTISPNLHPISIFYSVLNNKKALIFISVTTISYFPLGIIFVPYFALDINMSPTLRLAL